MNTRAAMPDSRAAWIVASAALAILTISYGAPLLSAVALKPIAAELGTSRSATLRGGFVHLYRCRVRRHLAGWLSGRIAIRWIVMFGAAMLAAGLFVSAPVGCSTLYVGHGVLMGLFGTSCMFAPLVTYVSRWFDRRRGAAVALISSGQSVAGAVWPVLFQAGINNLGWRHTMMLFGGFVVISIVLLALIFLRPPPGGLAAHGARGLPQARCPCSDCRPMLVMGLLMARSVLLLRADGDADAACRGVLRRPRFRAVAWCRDAIGAVGQRVSVAHALGLARRPGGGIANIALEFHCPGGGDERFSADTE